MEEKGGNCWGEQFRRRELFLTLYYVNLFINYRLTGRWLLYIEGRRGQVRKTNSTKKRKWQLTIYWGGRISGKSYRERKVGQAG